MEKEISKIVKLFLKTKFKVLIESLEFQSTRKDFEGDITVVLFPLLKIIKMNPIKLGEAIGAELKSKLDIIDNYNIINGFLNLTISSSFSPKPIIIPDFVNVFNELSLKVLRRLSELL